ALVADRLRPARVDAERAAGSSLEQHHGARLTVAGAGLERDRTPPAVGSAYGVEVALQRGRVETARRGRGVGEDVDRVERVGAPRTRARTEGLPERGDVPLRVGELVRRGHTDDGAGPSSLDAGGVD